MDNKHEIINTNESGGFTKYDIEQYPLIVSEKYEDNINIQKRNLKEQL